MAYLPQGLALYASLRKHCSDFRICILCMDEDVYEVLEDIACPEIDLISLKEFERGDDLLLKAKSNRTRIEYYFTCTPSLPLYAFQKYSNINLITYLDADLFFFANPEKIFQELANCSIGIIPHRYAPRYRSMEPYGIYNVGWLSFVHDSNSLSCLNWWREKCIDWCFKRYEDNRFADQKYLDEWPILFAGVKKIENKGANLACWNSENYSIKLRGNTLTVDEQELVFYHFHRFRQLTTRIYGAGYHQTRVNRTIRDRIYKPYLETLLDIRRELAQNQRYRKATKRSDPHTSQFHSISILVNRIGSLLYRFLVSGNYVVAPISFTSD
jgi:hypothetical protein